MFKADIHMKTHDMDERLGIECSISVSNADLGDKMVLMHTLAKGLQMSTLEIAIWALAEKDKAFDSGEIVEFRLPEPFKGTPAMSDILIRGLKMPESGFLNIEIAADGSIWKKFDGLLDATAIELPAHGDLVDRSEVLAVVDEAYEYGDIIERKDFDENNIPTIVPAEGSGK